MALIRNKGSQMKDRTRLDELTLREYVELRCGNHVEGVSEENAYNIQMEYAKIVNATEVKQIVTKETKRTKSKVKLNVLRIAQVVLRLGYVDDALRLINEIDSSITETDHDKLDAWLTSKIGFVEFGIKRDADIEEKNAARETVEERASPDEIRESFFAEVASIMSYHKMSISMDQISASVYAHLVEQTNREIQSRLRQTKKK